MRYLRSMLSGDDHGSDTGNYATGGNSHNEPGPELLVPGFLISALHGLHQRELSAFSIETMPVNRLI